MNKIERLIDLKLIRIAVGLVPLLLFAAALVFIFTKQQEQRIHHLLLESAAHASHSVDRAIGEQIGLLFGLSVSRSLDDGNFDEFRINAQRLLDVHPEWRTVIVTDKKAPLFNIVFQPGQVIPSLRDEQSLNRVWQTKEPYVGDFANGFVAVRVPVIRDEQMRYTLVVPVLPQIFLEAAQASPHIESRGFIIVGSDGKVITASSNAPASPSELLPPQFIINDSFSKAVGAMIFTPPCPIKTSGWQLILYAPESVVRAPFVQARLVVYAGGLLAIGLTVIMVLAIGAAWAARHKAIGLYAEITARKKAEESLLRNRQILQLFIEHAPAAIAMFDTEMRYIAVSNRFLSDYGITDREVIGRSHYELFPEVGERLKETHRRCLKGATERNTEDPFHRADGKIDWINWEVRPWHEPAGAIGGIVIFSEVVTDQVEAAKKLKESEKKFRDLFEKHAAVKLIIDPDTGDIVEANEAAEKFYGWPGEKLRRMRIQEINTLSPEQLAVEIEKVKNQQRIHFEFCHRLADGSLRDVAVYSSKIEIQGKALLHSIIHDISAQRQIEREKEKLREQLSQAQKMESVGQLAGGVAHDYNNMLTVIMGYCELAMEKTAADDPLHEDLVEIQSAARRSIDITRQLLAFARKQTISPVVLDLNTTIEGMLKMLRRLIGEDIDLSWLPETGLWAVKMDPSQIDQLLANLCINGRDAIAGVGKITIETGNATFNEAYCVDHFGYEPGEYAMVAVSDNGSGMDKETLAHIFEPFFTTKGVGEGTGLGLATVYGIVKQNYGFINVYSEPGKGTTFRLYLPRHTGNTTDLEESAVKVIPRGHGQIILLVEDEEVIREMGTKMLQQLGYVVLSARTPGEALRLAEEKAGSIDLLLTDVVMPEMNGRNLADQLHRLYPDIKVLFMSGYTSNVIIHRGVLDDGVNFLAKPFSKNDLALKVHRELGK